jgi:hypothetical protein
MAERGVRQTLEDVTGEVCAVEPDEFVGLLARVDALGSLVAVLRSRVLTAAAEAGVASESGDRDLAAWRARTSRQGSGAGLGQVRTARALAVMPAVEQALVDGEVTVEHAAALGQVTATASPTVEQALVSPEGQARVVELARRLDGRHFSRALSALTASWDPAAQQDSHDAAHEARFLHLSHTPEVTWIKGRLDAWAGKKLRLALESVSPRPGEGDQRTPEQRSADALEALADHALNTPEDSQATERPQVTILFGEGTWTSLRQARTTAVDAAGLVDDTDTAVPAEDVDLNKVPGGIDHMINTLRGQDPVRDVDGDTVPPAQLARLLCDCDLTRLVLSAKSEVLDHGRARRLFARSQRQAITIRDGGCGWPDCSMPARYTEIHHIDWWNRDHGHTSIDNGIALCSFHHHLIHQNNYRITRNIPPTTTTGPPRGRPGTGPPAPGRPIATYTIHRPDGTTITGTPPPMSATTRPTPRRPHLGSSRGPATTPSPWIVTTCG